MKVSETFLRESGSISSRWYCSGHWKTSWFVFLVIEILRGLARYLLLPCLKLCLARVMRWEVCRAASLFLSAVLPYMRQLDFSFARLTSLGIPTFCDTWGVFSGVFQQETVSRLNNSRKVWLILRIWRQLLSANSIGASPCSFWHASHVCTAWRFSASCLLFLCSEAYYPWTILLVTGSWKDSHVAVYMGIPKREWSPSP